VAADNKTGKGSSMTYFQAQDLLDLRKAGADMNISVVNKALEMTGDLETDNLQDLIDEAKNE